MFSVFSNTKKPSEIIRELSLCAGSNLNRLLFLGPEDEPLYILKPEVLNYPVNKEGLNIIEWVNKNILYELPKVKNYVSYSFIGVRIRIFSNMLNKLMEKNILSKDICIMYHQRLILRVKEILGKIYVEELPF
jgi:hypothetical protein